MSNFYGPLFKFSRWILSLFYKKYSVDKVANFKGPVVYVSHHQNMHGPIVTLLSFPKPLHVWALHVFLINTFVLNNIRSLPLLSASAGQKH